MRSNVSTDNEVGERAPLIASVGVSQKCVEREPHALRRARRRDNRAHGVANASVSVEAGGAGAVFAIREPYEFRATAAQ